LTQHPTAAPRFALSFTSGALLIREALVVAPIYLRKRDWTKTRAVISDDNLLQARTRRSSVRLGSEVVQRLAVLTDDEIELLAEATSSERGHLLWVAACRRYTLIGEFAEEVVRERFLLRTLTLSYEEFDAFIRAKALWHSELDELKDSTLQRLRSNLFRMLIEADLLTDSGQIVPAAPSPRVAEQLGKRTPSDLRFFPTAGEIAERTD
jgi:hypothetical protein